MAELDPGPHRTVGRAGRVRRTSPAPPAPASAPAWPGCPAGSAAGPPPRRRDGTAARRPRSPAAAESSPVSVSPSIRSPTVAYPAQARSTASTNTARPISITSEYDCTTPFCTGRNTPPDHPRHPAYEIDQPVHDVVIDHAARGGQPFQRPHDQQHVQLVPVELVQRPGIGGAKRHGQLSRQSGWTTYSHTARAIPSRAARLPSSIGSHDPCSSSPSGRPGVRCR